MLIDIDAYVWAKLQKEAATIGKSPEEMAAIFLDKRMESQCFTPAPAEAETPVTVEDGGGFLVVRIAGTAYQNLSRIAEALNSVEHFDHDNTAETVADAFFFGEMARRIADPIDALQEAYTVAHSIDTGTDDEVENRKRIDALYSAVDKFFAPVLPGVS